jgi:hypothetical protein
MEFPIFINKRIFWDADLSKMDMQVHKDFIITKVVEWVHFHEFKALIKYYSKDEIINALTSQKYLSKRTHKFATAILDIPKEQFECYTQRQLRPNAWPI